MNQRFNHLIDMDDYSVSQWNAMVKLAEDIMRRPESYADKCRGKILATLFYESSTPATEVISTRPRPSRIF